MAEPRQQVVTLPLANSVRQKLVGSGYLSVAELEGVSLLQLAAAAGLTNEEAALVLQLCDHSGRAGGSITGAVCAVDLYAAELAAPKIITFCPAMDKMLGGGVHTGQVTEFCGVPAVGKTQLGIQLAIDVQFPRLLHGVEGTAVYIDTEGSVVSDRVVEMAGAAVAHLRKVGAASGDAAKQQAASRVSVESLLAGMHYFRCHDAPQLLALLHALPAFLEQQQQQVRLVVIDSIAFPFRHEYDGDMGRRQRALARMGMQLQALASENGLAVVLTNHVTTQLADAPAGGRLVPALGDSWAHVATNRVILYWQDGLRYGFLYKSPSQPAAHAEYLVTHEGVRGRRPKRPRPDEASAGRLPQGHYSS